MDPGGQRAHFGQSLAGSLVEVIAGDRTWEWELAEEAGHPGLA